MPLFSMGQVVATPAALELCARNNVAPRELLHRHANGDWGNLEEYDAKANEHAVAYGDLRILSSYEFGESRVWIITEADRSSTCMLLPEEY